MLRRTGVRLMRTRLADASKSGTGSMRSYKTRLKRVGVKIRIERKKVEWSATASLVFLTRKDPIMNVFPSVIQCIGLACVPVAELTASEQTSIPCKPVAAAVLTLETQAHGQGRITAARVSDARDMELPLAWRLETELADDALTIISAQDRVALALEATARRFFVEPRLAALVAGDQTVDPGWMLGEQRLDEAALCRRLHIPTLDVSDAAMSRIWSRHAPAAAEEVALVRAVARMILWANIAAFQQADPAPFFRTLLPLQTWMYDQAERWPLIHRMATARPLMRASSFADEWHSYEQAKALGDQSARWVQFELGLFHS